METHEYSIFRKRQTFLLFLKASITKMEGGKMALVASPLVYYSFTAQSELSKETMATIFPQNFQRGIEEQLNR